jgi:hypothetical protein
VGGQRCPRGCSVSEDKISFIINQYGLVDCFPGDMRPSGLFETSRFAMPAV